MANSEVRQIHPGMSHDEVLDVIAWQEDHGVCPTSEYRPFARDFEQRFYAAVRAAADADPELRHHRMTDGTSLNSPMVYYAESNGQSGYVVYVGVEHRNSVPLAQQRTFMNAWYFTGAPDEDEQRTELHDGYFLTQDPAVLAALFMSLVRHHHG